MTSSSKKRSEQNAQGYQAQTHSADQGVQGVRTSEEIQLLKEQEQALAALFKYLGNILYQPRDAYLDIEELPPAFQNLGEGLLYFGKTLADVRILAEDISKGNLDTAPILDRNELGSTLKMLQATLRHLTWQIGQVARGDYKQRVDFAGDFSNSINNMIQQLDERDQALREEIKINLQKTEELQQSLDLLQVIIDNMEQWIIVLERKTGEWLYANHDPQAVLQATGFLDELKEWLNSEALLAEEAESEIHLGQHLVEAEAGQFFKVFRYPITWHNRKAYAFVLVDVTPERRLREELETMAYFDSLTNSYSRHFGMEILKKWHKSREPFVIVVADINDLKYANDTFGHIEGDRYIIEVANQMRSFSPDCVLCRLGGDEFMLLCKNANKTEAEQSLMRLNNNLAQSSPEGYTRSISYGVVEVSADNINSQSYLLGVADELMYKHKRAYKLARRAKV